MKGGDSMKKKIFSSLAAFVLVLSLGTSASLASSKSSKSVITPMSDCASINGHLICWKNPTDP